MLAVLFVVSVITFLIFNVIPNGDPAARMAGRNATPAQIDAVSERWGFDEPLPAQYAQTMQNLFTGNAVSYFTGLEVTTELWRALPRTLSLVAGAAVLSVFFGIGIGLLAAVRAGRTTDRLLSALGLIAVAVPVFWLAALMSHYLGFELSQALGFELFPNGGYVEFAESPPEWAHHLLLPWAALALGCVGVYSRVLRASVLETLDADFVRTARAKGVPERTVMLRHVLRASAIPLATLWGLDFAAVVAGGAILVESVFNLHGVGQYAADAVATLDMPPLLAVTMFGAFFVVIANAVVDVAYAWIDPRTRVGPN